MIYSSTAFRRNVEKVWHSPYYIDVYMQKYMKQTGFLKNIHLLIKAIHTFYSFPFYQLSVRFVALGLRFAFKHSLFWFFFLFLFYVLSLTFVFFFGPHYHFHANDSHVIPFVGYFMTLFRVNDTTVFHPFILSAQCFMWSLPFFNMHWLIKTNSVDVITILSLAKL